MNVYEVGDVVTITNTDAFVNSSGTATAPTAVATVVTKPDGSTTTFDIEDLTAGASTGIYVLKVTPAAGEHGVWRWSMVASGTATGGESGAFRVRESA